MSSLQVDNIQSYNTNPPVIKSASGAEVGTFCRAWVNFNGTGTVAIRQSFNVSSITDNGTGDYTVNFTTAMVDANYSLVGATGGYNGASSGSSNAVVRINLANLTALTTTTSRISTGHTDGNLTDYPNVCVAIFR